MFIALVVAAVASLGTPLITSVATSFHVSLGSAQWTLTAALLSGAVATPVLGRLGAGPRRRASILATLAGGRPRRAPPPPPPAVAGLAARRAGPGGRAGGPRSSPRWRSSSPAARSPCCRCRSRGCWPAGRPRASGSG